MKRLISICVLFVMILSLLCGCGKNSAVELESGEIVKSENAYTVNFTVVNNTGKTVNKLKLSVETFTKDGKSADKGEAEYPIDIENGAKATLSFRTEKECEQAKALSCTYKTENGKEASVEFKENNTAEIKKKSESTIMTREALAEEIIREVNSQFISHKVPATGNYDPEKKHLYIVSRYTDSYDYCLSSYLKSPSDWDSLVDGVVNMSQYCLQKFQDYKFDDVHVSVGVTSSDDEIMFSATDGELVESLGSQSES